MSCPRGGARPGPLRSREAALRPRAGAAGGTQPASGDPAGRALRPPPESRRPRPPVTQGPAAWRVLPSLLPERLSGGGRGPAGVAWQRGGLAAARGANPIGPSGSGPRPARRAGGGHRSASGSRLALRAQPGLRALSGRGRRSRGPRGPVGRGRVGERRPARQGSRPPALCSRRRRAGSEASAAGPFSPVKRAHGPPCPGVGGRPSGEGRKDGRAEMGAPGTLIPVFSPRRVLGGPCFPPRFGGEKGGGRRPLAGPAAAAPSGRRGA